MDNKNKYLILGIVCVFGIIGLFIISSVTPLFALTSDDNLGPEIRLAWMNSWAESALPAITMKNTDFVKNNGLNIEYIGFQYGPPMVEAAIVGEVDVLFVGILPSLSLLSKSDDWVIVGRLGYFQNSLMVRSDLNINSISELKGKKIALPVTTGPHPVVYKLLQDNGLDPKKDVTLLNIKPSDHGVAFETKQIDASSWGEPLTTIFTKKGLAYVLTKWDDIAVVIFKKSFVEKHPEEIKLFLESLKESFYYFSQNSDEIFKLAPEETVFDYDLIKEIKLVEPNYFAKDLKEINFDIPESWLPIMQYKADFEYNEGFFTKLVDVNKHIDLSFVPE
ncbi:MAG: NrtA/SsuA/CpmA family ABC transporter substrate-binding protein [Candidatus ainarchaeum sp.]|nr:NrtA/SsuA/CpmA family ABC transporter substrate-binding protein [Candidatus ainarchaeum sp.]